LAFSKIYPHLTTFVYKAYFINYLNRNKEKVIMLATNYANKKKKLKTPNYEEIK
jgi:hypothetical protein